MCVRERWESIWGKEKREREKEKERERKIKREKRGERQQRPVFQ
jgi:hypothetical protein